MGKKKKNSLRDVRNLDAMSFLKNYYGISHDSIENMTHDTIKMFFPQLQRTSFAYVQRNPELISTGKIILVEDVNHAMIPYLSPLESTFDDISLDLDDRERVIKKIIETTDISLKENIRFLFIVEGDDSLQPFAYQARQISSNILEEFLLSSMIEATNQDSGIIVKEDYSLIGYKVLNHGDSYYDTMVLPPLQRQAVGITKKTDSIGVFYDEGILAIVVDGIIEELSTIEELQKKLMTLFPIQKEREKEREFTETLSGPSSYALKEMPIYELEQLMRVYKISKQMAYYHVVRRELIRRTKAGKEFRSSKEKEKQKYLEGED